MTVGGSGFYSLRRKGKVLAYMAIDCFEARRSGRDYTKAAFFELHNPKEWAEIFGVEDEYPLSALQRVLDAGELGLHKINRSPTGAMQPDVQYDLKDVTIKCLPGGSFTFNGLEFPKNIQFVSPHAVMIDQTYGNSRLPRKGEVKIPNGD